MRSKDARRLLASLSETFRGLTAKKVEVAEFEGKKLYIFDNKIEFIEDPDGRYPTLNGTYLDVLPRVIVDMGAVRFICNGADIMAPGIVEVDEFPADAFVVVRDARHGKALAVGKAYKSSSEIIETKKGKAVKNLHYIGDKLWRNVLT